MKQEVTWQALKKKKIEEYDSNIKGEDFILASWFVRNFKGWFLLSISFYTLANECFEFNLTELTLFMKCREMISSKTKNMAVYIYLHDTIIYYEVTLL